jgi:hypothetical protein
MGAGTNKKDRNESSQNINTTPDPNLAAQRGSPLAPSTSMRPQVRPTQMSAMLPQDEKAYFSSVRDPKDPKTKPTVASVIGDIATAIIPGASILSKESQVIPTGSGLTGPAQSSIDSNMNWAGTTVNSRGFFTNEAYNKATSSKAETDLPAMGDKLFGSYEAGGKTFKVNALGASYEVNPKTGNSLTLEQNATKERDTDRAKAAGAILAPAQAPASAPVTVAEVTNTPVVPGAPELVANTPDLITGPIEEEIIAKSKKGRRSTIRTSARGLLSKAPTSGGKSLMGMIA